MPAVLRRAIDESRGRTHVSVALGPEGPFPSVFLDTELERRWLHYAFLAPGGQLGMVANVARLGPARDDSTRQERNTSIVLVHHQGEGWRASQFNANTMSPLWSTFRQPHPFGQPGRLELRSTTSTTGVAFDLHRTSHPCTSQCAVFGGDHHLRWQSETGVWATGDWYFGDRVFSNVEAVGYHERVRGRWGWPELGGWVFGFTNDYQKGVGGAPRTALVFTLIQPLGSADGATGSIMVWREGRLVRHFPRRRVTVAARGQLDRDRVTQVPALANLLGVAPMPPIPERLVVVGRMGNDTVVFDFTCIDAARVVIPCETSLRPFSVHEVIGSCHVEARLGGKNVAFSSHGIVEFAGGAGGH